MLYLIISLLTLIIFVLLISLGINSNNKGNEKYSFLNCFPFELIYESSYLQIMKILSSILGGLFASFGVTYFMFISSNVINTFLNYLIGSVFIIIGIIIFMLFMTNLNNYKFHLILSSLLFSLTIVNSLLISVFTLFTNKGAENLALGYLMIILSITLIVLLFLSPLKKWMYLEKNEQNGEVIYSRGKISILPALEWLFILFNIIVIILLVLF